MELSPGDRHCLAEGQAFTWHELVCKDVNGALNFYKNALGLEIIEHPMGGGYVYKMLGKNGVGLCGVTSSDEADAGPAGWSAYMAVDDVDERLIAWTSNGGTVIRPAYDIPTVGRMALVKDPHGATVWLFKPTSPA